MSRKVGFEAETLAASALELDGYEIVERNYVCRVGEIDIIAEKEGFTCFVEVKYRNSARYGSAVDAITRLKLNKILAAAKNYLYKTNQMDTDYRIDAVIIDNKGVDILPNIYTQGMN